MDDGAPSTVTPPSMAGGAPAPDGKRGRGARPRTRAGRGFLVAAVGALTLALVVAFLERGAPRHPPIDVSHRTPGELVSLDELRDRAAKAAAGQQPYADAVADLLAYAKATVRTTPEPQEPLEIQGTEGPFVDDTAAAYGLALAWVVTGDDAYAKASARFISAWVRTTRTTVNTCQDDGRCQTSLIIGRTAPAFVFAADLLRGSSSFPAADEAAFRDWLRTVILPTASRLPNNWGDAGTFLRIVATDYLGDAPGLRDAIERAYQQQDLVAADGHIPEETRRGTSGISYTQEALQYKVGSAVLAGRYGVDLWDDRGEGGATLSDALGYLARYWSHPGTWPWDASAEQPSTGPLWEIAFQRYRDPAYVPIIEGRRPFGSQGHSALRWTTLTNGIPLSEASSSRSPSTLGEPSP
jgi:hypothetical protein